MGIGQQPSRDASARYRHEHRRRRYHRSSPVLRSPSKQGGIINIREYRSLARHHGQYHQRSPVADNVADVRWSRTVLCPRAVAIPEFRPVLWVNIDTGRRRNESNARKPLEVHRHGIAEFKRTTETLPGTLTDDGVTGGAPALVTSDEIQTGTVDAS